MGGAGAARNTAEDGAVAGGVVDGVEADFHRGGGDEVVEDGEGVLPFEEEDAVSEGGGDVGSEEAPEAVAQARLLVFEHVDEAASGVAVLAMPEGVAHGEEVGDRVAVRREGRAVEGCESLAGGVSRGGVGIRGEEIKEQEGEKDELLHGHGGEMTRWGTCCGGEVRRGRGKGAAGGGHVRVDMRTAMGLCVGRLGSVALN